MQDWHYLYRMNAKEIISINCTNQNIPSKKAQHSAKQLNINEAKPQEVETLLEPSSHHEDYSSIILTTN
jgi:hypothetical protein